MQPSSCGCSTNRSFALRLGFPEYDYISMTLMRARKPKQKEEFNVTIYGPWYMTLDQLNRAMQQLGEFHPPQPCHLNVFMLLRPSDNHCRLQGTVVGEKFIDPGTYVAGRPRLSHRLSNPGRS